MVWTAVSPEEKIMNGRVRGEYGKCYLSGDFVLGKRAEKL